VPTTCTSLSRFLPLALILLTAHAQVSEAACYVVGKLEGYSVRNYNEYQFTEDGWADAVFNIVINGENSQILGYDAPTCFEITDNSIACINTQKEGSVSEVWTIAPSTGRVIVTKAIQGRVITGGSLFLGEVLGSCAP
jgi:hypothetical protein